MAAITTTQTINVIYSLLTTSYLAEGEGFEPPVASSATTVFKTVAIDHSATPPGFSVARREGLEPPTNGFGDRYSTN